MLDIGNGLWIYKVPVETLKEQDENARNMDEARMERLTMTIRRDKRLESLPLCAMTENGIEVVSGHHRTRAAKEANLPDIFCIVDVTGLSRDQIRAKQLAHNSIQGEDNAEILQRIFSKINNAESKMEAFIPDKIEIKFSNTDVQALSVKVDYKSIGIIFLPTEHERWKAIAETIGTAYPELYVADLEKFALFKQLMNRMVKEYDIRAFNLILDKIAEMMEEKLGKEPEEQEIVAIRDLFGTANMSRDTAAIVKQALDKMIEKDELDAKNKGKALEFWAANYLAGA